MREDAKALRMLVSGYEMLTISELQLLAQSNRMRFVIDLRVGDGVAALVSDYVEHSARERMDVAR